MGLTEEQLELLRHRATMTSTWPEHRPFGLGNHPSKLGRLAAELALAEKENTSGSGPSSGEIRRYIESRKGT